MNVRVLLDTHVLIWWLATPEKLKPAGYEVIVNPRHRIGVSMASIWEMTIKTSIGKLVVPDDLEHQIYRHRFEVLPLTFAHVRRLAMLPWHHCDPFDRMLIAQAQVENVPIITRDQHFSTYDVPLIGA